MELWFHRLGFFTSDLKAIFYRENRGFLKGTQSDCWLKSPGETAPQYVVPVVEMTKKFASETKEWFLENKPKALKYF